MRLIFVNFDIGALKILSLLYHLSILEFQTALAA